MDPDRFTRIDIYWQRMDMLYAIFYSSNWYMINKAEDYFAEHKNISTFRHFWSLAIEEQYYIVWPLLFSLWIYLYPLFSRFFPKSKYHQQLPEVHTNISTTSNSSPENIKFGNILKSLLIGEIIVILSSQIFTSTLLASHTPIYVLHYSSFVHVKEFALGGITAILVKLIPSLESYAFVCDSVPYTKKLTFSSRLLIEIISFVIILSFLSLLLFEWSSEEKLFQWYFSYGSFMISIAINTLFVLLAIQNNEMIEKEKKCFFVSELFLSSKIMAFGGLISYQTYLWHLPIILWTGVNFIESETIINSLYLSLVFISVFIIYFWSSITYLHFETPVAKFVMTFKNPLHVILKLSVVMLLLSGIVMIVTRNMESPYSYIKLEKDNEFSNSNSIGKIMSPLYDQCTKYQNINYNKNNYRMYSSYLRLSDNNLMNMIPFEMMQLLRHYMCISCDADRHLFSNRTNTLVIMNDYKGNQTCTDLHKFIDYSSGTSSSYFIVYLYATKIICPGYLNKDVHIINKKTTILSLPMYPMFSNISQNIWSYELDLETVRYVIYRILEALFKLQPRLFLFFECSELKHYSNVNNDQVDSKNSYLTNNDNNTNTQENILFIGDSIARRLGYLVENIRKLILQNCLSNYSFIDENNRKSFQSLSDFRFFVSSRKASLIEDMIYHKMDIDREIGVNIQDMRAKTVILHDARFTHHWYDNALNTFLNFSSLIYALHIMKYSWKIENVYMLSLHHFPHYNNHMKTVIAFDSHVGHVLSLYHYEAEFKECVRNILKWNYSNYYSNCFETALRLQLLDEQIQNLSILQIQKLMLTMLNDIKTMLYIPETFHLTCPSPTLRGDTSTIVCPAKAWGYSPMFVDRIHPSGAAGDFLATGILLQITDNRYLQNTLRSDQFHSHKRLVNSNFSILTTKVKYNNNNNNNPPNSISKNYIFGSMMESFSKYKTCDYNPSDNKTHSRVSFY